MVTLIPSKNIILNPKVAKIGYTHSIKFHTAK